MAWYYRWPRNNIDRQEIASAQLDGVANQALESGRLESHSIRPRLERLHAEKPSLLVVAV